MELTQTATLSPLRLRLAALLAALAAALFVAALRPLLPAPLVMLVGAALLVAAGIGFSPKSAAWSDWPMLLLLAGTFVFGRAFALISLPVAGLPLYVSELLLGAALAALLRRGRLWRGWRPFVPNALAGALGLFFLLGLLYMAIGAAGYRQAALRDAPYSLYALFLPPLLALLDGRDRARALLKAALPAAGALLLFGLCRFFVVLPVGALRDVARESKMIGMSLSLGLLLIFALSFRPLAGRRAGRWLLAVAYLALLLLVLAEVRAAWVGILAALALLVLLQKGEQRLTRLLAAAAGATALFLALWRAGLLLAGVLAALALLAGLLRRDGRLIALLLLAVVASVLLIDAFGLSVQGNKLDSLKGEITALAAPNLESMSAANIRWRISIWKQTWAAIREFPLFGWGYGAQVNYIVWGLELSWLKAIGSSTGILPPHNHLLSVTYKMGLAGLLLYLFVHGYVFWYGLRRRALCRDEFTRRLLTAALAGLLFWHGAAFFFDVLESPPTSIFQWLLIAIVLVAARTATAPRDPA